jgi:DNA-binding winged helix-turn-helix (wHTH) protein
MRRQVLWKPWACRANSMGSRTRALDGARMPRVAHRFGSFTLDPQTRRLLRDGEEKHLSPKAFELLTLLLDNRARAMSKSDLQRSLWPSTYVLETNLASLVAEIRRVLDDSADEPVFIRTMHRFGYWFVAAVEEGDAAVTAPDGVKYWVLWDTRQVPLAAGQNVLGRAPDASIWIDAAGVSRHHARIVVNGATATLEDLGSKNGTYLRGERVTSSVGLNDGDQIRLGSVLITFRIPPPAGSTETAHR